MGEGPPTPLGILVGENPSREDADCRRPFAGTTGRQLDDEILEAGLLRTRLFLVNVTCCMPQERTEAAMKKATECCHPAFRAQLSRFDPRTPVFAMGKWSLYALTGRVKGVGNVRGFIRSDWTLMDIPASLGDTDDERDSDADSEELPARGSGEEADEDGD